MVTMGPIPILHKKLFFFKLLLNSATVHAYGRALCSYLLCISGTWEKVSMLTLGAQQIYLRLSRNSNSRPFDRHPIRFFTTYPILPSPAVLREVRAVMVIILSVCLSSISHFLVIVISQFVSVSQCEHVSIIGTCFKEPLAFNCKPMEVFVQVT